LHCGGCVSTTRIGDAGTATHTCGRNTLLTEERKARLLQLLAESPDATLAELGAKLDRSFGTSIIDLWLRQLGWIYKKNSVRQRTKPSRRGQTKGVVA
jgi:transposase